MRANSVGYVMAKPQNAETRAKTGAAHPVDVHVGARVKFRRMIMGLSQQTLGEQLGLTFQQVQKYEKGANRISASRMYEIAKLLQAPIQFFYDEFGDEEGVGASPGMAESGEDFMDLVSSPEGVQLCRYFAAITDPDVKRRVLDLVRSIAETHGAEADGADLS